jgi:small subunit ribosomal protein S16
LSVKIRLRRTGTKKQPHYRLVVTDSRSPRDGRFIEVIGHYHPMSDPPAIELQEERALLWLQRGAQPTETARSVLQRQGIWRRFTADRPQVAPKRKRARAKRAAERADRPRPAPKPAAKPAAKAAPAPEAEPAEE